jgi:hypothetical protein
MKKKENTKQTKNEKPLWFRAKWYGWGWYPSTREGWIITGLFIAFIVFWGTSIKNALPNQWIWYWLGLIGAVGALLAICFHFGEKPEWRWGNKPIFKKK